MITWSNLFDGYNVYTDVYTAHPAMYSDAVASGSAYSLIHQFVLALSTDLWLLFGVFFTVIVPLGVVCWLGFVFFLPIFNRPRRW